MGPNYSEDLNQKIDKAIKELGRDVVGPFELRNLR